RGAGLGARCRPGAGRPAELALEHVARRVLAAERERAAGVALDKHDALVVGAAVPQDLRHAPQPSEVDPSFARDDAGDSAHASVRLLPAGQARVPSVAIDRAPRPRRVRSTPATAHTVRRTERRPRASSRSRSLPAEPNVAP